MQYKYLIIYFDPFVMFIETKTPKDYKITIQYWISLNLFI